MQWKRQGRAGQRGYAAFMSAHVMGVTLFDYLGCVVLTSSHLAQPLLFAPPKPQLFIVISNETQMVPERTIFTFHNDLAVKSMMDCYYAQRRFQNKVNNCTSICFV